MDDYRLYRMDGVGQIMLVELIKAADDKDAIQQAAELGQKALTCELWHGRRLVSTLGHQRFAK